jgi:small subunit ribosomal protein S17
MQEEKKSARKVQEGVVISNKMQKTVTVRVERKLSHSVFGKTIVRAKKYYAHVDSDKIDVGQKVRIMETRPLSKIKRWRVVEILA